MTGALVECVPNFSEGRRADVVERIANEISGAGGIVLHTTLDPDHNRSVITFAGAPDAVLEAAVRAAGAAAALIDLTHHAGEHPRIGALDVLPFVPLRGASMAGCVDLARRAASAIWLRHGVPSYFYEHAATRPDRRNLADVRRGQFEGLREAALRDPARAPDTGGPALHPTAGAIAIGARGFLIAFNVNLSGADLAIAREIARRVRASSGGLPCVKALGLWLEHEGVAQVSMNLTDFRVTPVRAVFDAIRAHAAELGAAVKESELIGLAPAAALDASIAAHVRLRDFHPGRVIEQRLAERGAVEAAPAPIE